MTRFREIVLEHPWEHRHGGNLARDSLTRYWAIQDGRRLAPVLRRLRYGELWA